MNPDKTESHDWLCMYAGTLRIQGLRDEEIFYFLLAEFNGTPYLCVRNLFYVIIMLTVMSLPGLIRQSFCS